MLFVVGGIFVVVASDTTQTYNVAIVGYLACGLVLTTSSVNALVYWTNGAREAAAAEFILLSMVTVSCDKGFVTVKQPLTVGHRLSGSSTSATPRRPFRAPTSIHSPWLRSRRGTDSR